MTDFNSSAKQLNQQPPNAGAIMDTTMTSVNNDKENRLAKQKHNSLIMDEICSSDAMKSVALWKPQPGKPLAGVFLGDQKPIGGNQNSQRKQIVIKTHKEVVAVALTKELETEILFRQDACHGDLIAIHFHGKSKDSRGKPYDSYSVSVVKGYRF